MRRVLPFLLLPLLLAGYVYVQEKPLRVTYPKTKTGEIYTFFYQDSHAIHFETTRPAKDDKNVLICIAAAFTTLEKDDIDGLAMVNGKVIGGKNVIF